MKSFPTIHDLATATEDEVNAHWAGLGFYRRARLLHQGAKFVVQELNGELPTTPEELSKLPGIGPYTAAAIASIAYNVCVPVVDGNVCRVLSRLTGIANHIKHPLFKDKLGWTLAAEIVKAGDGSTPGLVNQAMMELGATFCAPSGSGIDAGDPLKEYYMSTKLGRAILSTREDQKGQDDIAKWMDSLTSRSSAEESCRLCDRDGVLTVLQKLQESITKSTSVENASKAGHSVFPMDPPRSDKREEDLAMAVISVCDNNCDNNVRYLMIKRASTGLLAGQWEFPNVCVQIRNSKERNKSKPTTNPSTNVSRQRALTNYLADEVFCTASDCDIAAAISQGSREVDGQPLEHIFSHVRHFMWLETLHLPQSLNPDSLLQWTSSSGRQVRWMANADMEEVGITSGVKKVLKVVQGSAGGLALRGKKRRK
jgi:A/G-specific adenine glycosylase